MEKKTDKKPLRKNTKKIADYKQDFLLDKDVKDLRQFAEKHGLNYKSVSVIARANNWVKDKKKIKIKAEETVMEKAPVLMAKEKLDAAGRLTDFADMLSGYQGMSFKRWVTTLQKLTAKLQSATNGAVLCDNCKSHIGVDDIEKRIDYFEKKIDGSRMWRRVLEYLDRVIVDGGGVSERKEHVLTYDQAKIIKQVFDAEFSETE